MMTKITTFDLAPFYRTSIGVDRLFDRILNQIDHAASNNYPPYNIVKTGEHTFELQLAVAGFQQHELDISVKDGVITVKGEKGDVTVLPEGHEFFYQGISARRFVRSWPLGEYVEVRDAELKDGILSVKLEQVLPESARPKQIAITHKS
jgi:molecular chaperone IbpA